MQTIQHILMQLGLAVVSSIWQMAILWLAYRLVVTAFSFKAETKFKVSLALIVCCTFWFLISFGYSVFTSNHHLTGIRLLPLIGMLPNKVAIPLNSLLGAGYLAILIIYIIRGKNTLSQIWHFKPLGSPKAPAGLRSFVERYAKWLEIPRSVNLLISSADVPLTFGWLKPVILIPASCLSTLSTKQLEAILLHELAHIKRNDYLWGMVLFGCEKILWFNPFLLSLVKDARMEAENACDDWVVQFEFCARDYALALLQMAKTPNMHSVVLAASGNNDYQLLGRIKRMLGLPAANRHQGLKEVLTGIFLVFLSLQLVILVENPHTNNPAQTTGRFATTIYKDANNYWEQTVSNARRDIFDAAVGKNRGPDHADASTKYQDVTKSKVHVNKLATTIDLELAIKTNQEPSPEVMLSTGWVNEAQEIHKDSAINVAWEEFAVLLDKLETPGNLHEEEWKELTQYIAYHTEIKKAIFKKADRLRNPFQTSINKNDTQHTDEVLLIVFDEATGTLAASFVSKQQVAEEYQIAEISNNEQQVIFLHKKAKYPSKIISL